MWNAAPRSRKCRVMGQYLLTYCKNNRNDRIWWRQDQDHKHWETPVVLCGPFPDRPRKRRCINAIDGKDERPENLCVRKCLARKKRSKVERGTEFLTRANPKLKRKDEHPTKLESIKGIAKHFNINIRVYEPKTNSELAQGRVRWHDYWDAEWELFLHKNARGVDEDAEVRCVRPALHKSLQLYATQEI